MRKNFLGLDYYIIGPAVVLLILVSVWLTLAATYENYRVGAATNQIIRVVSLARDMRVPVDASPIRAAGSFFERLMQLDSSEVEQIAPAFLGKEAEYGVVNPWGERMRVFFYPAARALRLETAVSASACGKMLKFYSKDLGALGVRRIDVKEDDPARLWRLVYEEGKVKDNKTLTSEAIRSGCGVDGQNLLSLTFYL